MASAASPSKFTNGAAFSPSESLFATRSPTQDPSTSPNSIRKSLEHSRYKPDASLNNHENMYMSPASIRIRYLPRSMTRDTLAGMLLFAEDLLDSNFATSESPEDAGYVTAVAHFKTYDAAREARAKLHGKPTSETHLVVEMMAPYGERYSEDGDGMGTAFPNLTSVRHSNSNGKNSRSFSRFNSTFQSISGRNMHAANAYAVDPVGEELQHPQSLLEAVSSPRSAAFADAMRLQGNSMIGVDVADGDTGELLRDPIAFANKKSPNSSGRRAAPISTGSLPISRMNSLSLNTNDVSNSKGLHISPPSASAFQSMQPIGSPSSEMSPTATRSAVLPSMSSAGGFPLSPQHLQRHHYPPANPADQNPPCNTLYVGNLPMDTSEDELKAVFSKQRGYKRLCFRTKHNGPMCFVEFEDVSFATKALNELYGHPLHNSVKGGIRLSFSKNPLGVRSGQVNSLGPHSPLGSPTGLGFGNGVGVPPGFSTASGPPPGLGAPPGLSPPLSAGAGMTGFFGPTSPQSLASSLHAARGSIANAFPASASSGMPQSPHSGNFH